MGEAEANENDLLEDIDGTITTVSDLNDDIGIVIDDADLSFDYLIGDVVDDFLSNGTLHFDLVDSGATLHCLAFNPDRMDIPALDDGDRVAVQGRLNYYEKRGNCSVIVDEVILIGDSHYQRKIAELRAALKDEGLFDDDVKTPLPDLPAQVGIITAAGSDAEEDAINGIHNRYPDINIYLCNARVQGDAAVEEICRALQYFDAFTPVDVIVLTRGGGSDQDLQAFNTEGVSRMVASTSTPVVTAIGHENDTPIVDDVADARAMTPTEIGATVAPSKTQLQERNGELRDRLQAAYRQTTAGMLREHRAAVETAYEQHVTATLTDLQNSLDSAYTQHVQTGITELRNDLDSAHRAFKQEKRHEEETEELEAQQRRYKAAVAVLILLLIVLGIIWFVL